MERDHDGHDIWVLSVAVVARLVGANSTGRGMAIVTLGVSLGKVKVVAQPPSRAAARQKVPTLGLTLFGNIRGMKIAEGFIAPWLGYRVSKRCLEAFTSLQGVRFPFPTRQAARQTSNARGKRSAGEPRYRG
ncbi:MAG: hypothetical protein ACT6RN_13695 [Agrobacterium sp.]|uniref:hypothetical protein n=1 Tax=Agrobacterium sp. TaxID=361 RepID=UPI0040380061